MAVLLESPWYREIEQRGEQRGKKEGLLSGISTSLELKFGTKGLQLMPEIQQLDSVETLEVIFQGIKTVKTLDELRQVYRI